MEAEDGAWGVANVALVGGEEESVTEDGRLGDGKDAEVDRAVERGGWWGQRGGAEQVGRGRGRILGGVRLRVREDELGEPVDEELSEGEEAGELVRHAEPEGDLVLEGVDDVGEGLVHVVPEGVEVVETPLRAEMGLVAVGDGEELSALELLVLEDSATDGKKGVVEVVVVWGLVEPENLDGGADLGVGVADQPEVVEACTESSEV